MDESALNINFHWRIINKEDSDCVAKFFADNFSGQNPLRQIFRVGPERAAEIDKKRVKTNIGDGFSLGVFEAKTGEPASFEINTISCSLDQRIEKQLYDNLNEKENAMMSFVRFMEEDAFTHLKAKQIFWMNMGAIAEKYRGLPTPQPIVEFREKLAKSSGCDYIVGVAMSRFAQRRMKKIGFNTLKTVRYSEYVNQQTGEKPDLDLSSIHTEASLIYKPLLTQSEKFSGSKL